MIKLPFRRKSPVTRRLDRLKEKWRSWGQPTSEQIDRHPQSICRIVLIAASSFNGRTAMVQALDRRYVWARFQAGAFEG